MINPHKAALSPFVLSYCLLRILSFHFYTNFMLCRVMGSLRIYCNFTFWLNLLLLLAISLQLIKSALYLKYFNVYSTLFNILKTLQLLSVVWFCLELDYLKSLSHFNVFNWSNLIFHLILCQCFCFSCHFHFSQCFSYSISSLRCFNAAFSVSVDNWSDFWTDTNSFQQTLQCSWSPLSAFTLTATSNATCVLFHFITYLEVLH